MDTDCRRPRRQIQHPPHGLDREIGDKHDVTEATRQEERTETEEMRKETNERKTDGERDKETERDEVLER